jgi:UDP-N-acetylglucosamine/UDP-N-acetylgalactosamine diphosphorylase
MPTPTATYESLKPIFEKAGQSQVFEYFEQISKEQQQELCAQLVTIDPTRVAKIFKTAVAAAQAAKDAKSLNIEPVPQNMTASAYSTPQNKLNEWYDAGLQHIANGKVAVILMAGGQGTRLGSSLPKGCFDIELPSHKSLFQIQAERIRKIQQVANKQFQKNAIVTWYVMTSGPTRKETESFFIKNKFFGLEQRQVIFFEQGVLPAMSTDGLILLEEKHQVAVFPYHMTSTEYA